MDFPFDIQGYLHLRPKSNDWIILRNICGSGNEKFDHVVSWAQSAEELDADPKLKADMEGLYGEITGGDHNEITAFASDELNTPNKTSTGCFSLGVTFQTPRQLSAPSKDSKVKDVAPELDARISLRKRIVNVVSRASVMGFKKAPAEIVEPIELQAEMTNLPRVGCEANFFHPAFQMNIARVLDPEDENGGEAIEDLGNRGIGHADCKDSLMVPSSVTTANLSDQDMEPMYMYLVELGIAWTLEPLSTIYFSGLRHHTSSKPIYQTNRAHPDKIFHRIVVIGYAPDTVAKGMDTVAFANLPNKQLLTLGYDIRSPLLRDVTESRVEALQATYASDGAAIMEQQTQAKLIVRGLQQMCISVLEQCPPTFLPRLNSDFFAKAFTFVIGETRVDTPIWKYGPGSFGSDALPGKSYREVLEKHDCQTMAELALNKPKEFVQLMNTDDEELQDVPYGNQALGDAMKRCKEHMVEESSTIPLVVAAVDKEKLNGRVSMTIQGALFSAANLGLGSILTFVYSFSGLENSASGKKKRKKKVSNVTEAEEPPAKRIRVFFQGEQSDSDGENNQEDDDRQHSTSVMMEFDASTPEDVIKSKIRKPVGMGENFMSKVTAEEVEKEVKAFQKAASSLSKPKNSQLSNGLVGSTADSLERLGGAPFEGFQCQSLRSLDVALKSLSVSVKTGKSIRLLAQVVLFEAVERKVVLAWRERDQQSSDWTDPAVSRLVFKFKKAFLDSRTAQPVVIDPDELAPQCPSATLTINFPDRSTARPTIHDTVSYVVLGIIASTLNVNFDQARTIRGSYFLARRLIRLSGPSSLFVASIFKACACLKNRVFFNCSGSTTAFSNLMITQHTSFLPHHPFTDPNSDVAIAIQKLGQLALAIAQSNTKLFDLAQKAANQEDPLASL
ncbi:hypothetical protein CPB83DRAFT_900608 [Crepidotus variabilis]|uniref:Uncharacterized protein n=1 Tax=Crepidotus variabilis TaxID=179855 RepID=A0A9P6E2X8_9AGAR|nr:hypothetical protein CPB83DRAFT_900608 [Crepidotus variabilis]